MYDITNRNSFNSISEWTSNIYEIKNHDFPLVLIGNKCDLKDDREVSEEEGLETAEKYKTTYFETSAKEGINIEKPIDELLNNIIKKKC
jgi:small GTP-binding protein